MGTRADFYYGVGSEMTYIGSIAWAGGPWSIPLSILDAQTEHEYRLAVEEFLANRVDASLADDHGWPWPWENSITTDFTYTYLRGCKVSCFGSWWVAPNVMYTEDENGRKPKEDYEYVGGKEDKMKFPCMKEHRKEVAFDIRSGLCVLNTNTKCIDNFTLDGEPLRKEDIIAWEHGDIAALQRKG